ncbi:hypothetical protein SAMN02745135_01146 [Caloranaerobacter azorensis DSM 13643]|uniref:Uncharacterized protein n=1 Tax=Caloranaerobacter azorensis DSM 13643 TaxID=1121264 RepID=A0A1M5TV47_9FIRM|nr:hypothetical protein [Caloranaerobacter azorensis]SHH54476.1 hypothetical protein SAMN02745135_01146 [Caloranaerobacter azorensis DSM 13643]
MNNFVLELSKAIEQLAIERGMSVKPLIGQALEMLQRSEWDGSTTKY